MKSFISLFLFFNIVNFTFVHADIMQTYDDTISPIDDYLEFHRPVTDEELESIRDELQKARANDELVIEKESGTIRHELQKAREKQLVKDYEARQEKLKCFLEDQPSKECDKYFVTKEVNSISKSGPIKQDPPKYKVDKNTVKYKARMDCLMSEKTVKECESLN